VRLKHLLSSLLANSEAKHHKLKAKVLRQFLALIVIFMMRVQANLEISQ